MDHYTIAEYSVAEAYWDLGYYGVSSLRCALVREGSRSVELRAEHSVEWS